VNDPAPPWEVLLPLIEYRHLTATRELTGRLVPCAQSNDSGPSVRAYKILNVREDLSRESCRVAPNYYGTSWVLPVGVVGVGPCCCCDDGQQRADNTKVHCLVLAIIDCFCWCLGNTYFASFVSPTIRQ
jgi:hypothetical protein